MATYDACGKEMPKKWRKRKEPPFWVVLVHTLTATEERGEKKKKDVRGRFLFWTGEERSMSSGR